MADDKIVDLIDQLLAESEVEKQKAILAEVCKLLAEEREERKKAKGTAIKLTARLDARLFWLRLRSCKYTGASRWP